MALTGLQIYKLLPKKNCGECGPPTCLAFAMQLAQGKASLDSCPYASDEAKETLGAASAPPIRLITVGTGDHAFSVGDETVLFRHDKTFYHPTGIAVMADDTLDDAALREKIHRASSLRFERIGQMLGVGLIAINNGSSDPQRFRKAAEIAAGITNLPLILITGSPEAAGAALEVCGQGKPLLHGATGSNYEAMAELAKKYSCPLGVKGQDLNEVSELAEKLSALGCKDLVLDPGTKGLADMLAEQTHIRRLSIKKRVKSVGYPTIVFPNAPDRFTESLEAGVHICKYGGIVVLREAEASQVLPLATLVQSIYTDPQEPIKVEPKVYEVGNVDEYSPVYVSTNFSLTYFSVLGEIEASKLPSYLLIVDTEGTSVLTAWASGKFDGEKVAEAIEKTRLSDLVKHRKVIIPGYVAVLKAKIEDKSGWQVIVGPREATAIPSFIKQNWDGKGEADAEMRSDISA